MKKGIVFIISIIVIFVAMFIGIWVYNKGIENEKKTEENTNKNEETVNNMSDIKVNTRNEEIKLSPNCSLLFKTKYKKCNHTSNKYINIPKELVNKTKKELEEKYPEWKIEVFKNNKVELLKTEEGQCEDHYVLKDINGKIIIFKINEKGEETEYQKTDISTEYITETDKVTMKNGLKVYGKENLSQLIEDFE